MESIPLLPVVSDPTGVFFFLQDLYILKDTVYMIQTLGSCSKIMRERRKQSECCYRHLRPIVSSNADLGWLLRIGDVTFVLHI